MKEKIKKIFNITKTTFIFLIAIIFISIWMGIFQEFIESKPHLVWGGGDNIELSGFFRIIKLLPLFIFVTFLVKKIGDWKKKKSNN